MKIISAAEFDSFWKENASKFQGGDQSVEETVKEIINEIRKEGDAALRRLTIKFDKKRPEKFEIGLDEIREAADDLERSDPRLARSLRFSAQNVKQFALAQREQFRDFEIETAPGVFAGQRAVPVARAACYVPGGRFPLISSALMCLIPAFCAGVKEACLVSPPSPDAGKDALPDRRILAAAGIAAETCSRFGPGFRAFCAGGAQAAAAFALGTETVPRCDVIAGPGNKYFVEAKRVLFGETGIDLLPGPSDILVVCAEGFSSETAAADMLAQAEHDPDARARALVFSEEAAENLLEAIERRLNGLPQGNAARASLDSGGLIVICKDKNEAVRIANAVSPEHLELHAQNCAGWAPHFENYGSLFTGALAAEVLGDYSSGLNHTLPTSGTSRFTGGLSVRAFLKTATTLRCENAPGCREALAAAQAIALAEGLSAHAASAEMRLRLLSSGG